MTGRHEFRSGVSQTRGPGQNMSLKATTIAQVLQSAGYTTGIFGKWHLGLEPPYHPSRRGFDEEFTFLTGKIGEYNHANASYVNPILLHNGRDEKTSGYCTDVFFNRAMQWIGEVKGRKPFFAYIPTNVPHAPVRCPEAYERMYADKAKDPKMAKYYGMLANLDDNVGRLMAQLEAWDLERNTLLVFMSDNGAALSANDFKGGLSPAKVFNAGMRGGKGSANEGGTRVPSFWRWPDGFTGGVDVDQLASNIDFFPTLAELAGAKIPDGLQLDGRSLVPLLKNPQADWPDRFVFIHADNLGGKAAEWKFTGSAVRSNRFRFINNNQLYDIKADPGETKNVLNEHPDMVARMRAAYDQWWEEVLPALEASAVSQ
jgi:arylsulfatase